MRFIKLNLGAHDLTLNFTNFTPFLRRIYVIPCAYLKKIKKIIFKKKIHKKTKLASSGVHAPVQIEILPSALRPVYTGDICGDLSGDFCGDLSPQNRRDFEHARI